MSAWDATQPASCTWKSTCSVAIAHRSWPMVSSTCGSFARIGLPWRDQPVPAVVLHGVPAGWQAAAGGVAVARHQQRSEQASPHPALGAVYEPAEVALQGPVAGNAALGAAVAGFSGGRSRRRSRQPGSGAAADD